jgi:hypothetical protein
MTRSLKTRIERLEDEYQPPVVNAEDIDPVLLVRRLAFAARLAKDGDERALALFASSGIDVRNPGSDVDTGDAP